MVIEAIKETLNLSWTLVGLIIATLTLTGSAQQITGLATIITLIRIWLATISFRKETRVNMSHEARKKSLLKKHGLKGVNKPKRTPGHKTKSHMVLAQKGHELKLIRFGQQGVRGAGKNPKSKKDKARKKSYYARHNAQDRNPSIMSARYWSHKVKW